MKIVLNQTQIDNLIKPEDIEFVKKFKEKFNHYPKFRELQSLNDTVGSIMPDHPLSELKTKTYVDKHLKGLLKFIVAKVKNELNEPLDDIKVGSRNYVTLDKKHILRSELEALTYNIFYLEGLSDEIEVDSKKFKKTCGKEPDFVWEDKKIVIEVAGLEDENYKEKLQTGSECIEKQGYKVYIVDSRPFEKQGKYLDYYLYMCKLLGFEPKKEVIESPLIYLGWSEPDRKFKQDYIDNKINKLSYSPAETYTLNKYLNQLYGYGVKEYKMRKGLKRFKSSPDRQEVLNFKKNNPNLSNQEIAQKFGISKNTVQLYTRGMQGKVN